MMEALRTLETGIFLAGPPAREFAALPKQTRPGPPKRMRRPNAELNADAGYFSTDGAIDAAVVAIGWDCAPICADTETNPNASIHTTTIVAKAIANGRSLRWSITIALYRPELSRFRDIAASPSWPPFLS
jgi:hypothetical protein